MGDVFDLTALGKYAPKYLDLDSLKEALPVEGSEVRNVEDVTMEDEEIEPSDAQDDKVEISDEIGMEVEAPQQEKHNDEPEIHERDNEDDLSTLQKVMSPTRSGAQLALRHPPEDLEYSYEIRMPLPSPWHENLPYMLSTYLQVAFNCAILCFAGWLIFVLNHDVTMKIQERTDKLTRDASWCQEQFLVNGCRSGTAPPHLVENKHCLELEHCMDIDPTNVRRISMYASLFAEVLNELVQPLHWRTLASSAATLAVVGVTVFGINYVFGFLRARLYFVAHQHQQQVPVERTNPELKIRAIGPNASIWRDRTSHH